MIIKKEDIDKAISLCNDCLNCNECSKKYGKAYKKPLTPCNIVRKLYGESIWNYKNKK